MSFNLSAFLLIFTLISGVALPGYAAYIGAYAAMGASILALLIYGWRERDVFIRPFSLALLSAIALVGLTLPFVYRGEPDLMAPVLILPMLIAPAMAMLGRPARIVPAPLHFAFLCLLAVTVALAGGLYERFTLDIYRPGLGNNPIHYATLAAIVGNMALVGLVSTTSPWRYIFLAGPLMGLAAAVIADSRGPMAGSIAMLAAGLALLTLWHWRERAFRRILVVVVLIGAAALASLVMQGNPRVLALFDGNVFNIFRFTGGSDDIRVALYISALEALKTAPVFGLGLGQIMVTAETLFPDLVVGTGLENLHADWANFAAMAGGLGLAAYLLLLAAPLLLLLDPKIRRERAIVLGAVMLAVGQASLGVSNAMFGVLPQTVIYATMLGYLAALARRRLSAFS